MRLRRLLIPAQVLCLSLALNPWVQAQEKYPTKPISFIIPYGAGGASDLFWRTLMEELKAELKVPINATNKTGAGGLSGVDFVAHAKPDGYNLLAGVNTAMTVAPAIDPKAYRDLMPIMVVGRQACLIVTRSNHEIKTLEEMVKRAKAKPNSLTVGTSGVTASTYFDLALFEKASGTSFSHVPVAQSNEGMTMVLGGHIDFWMGTLAAAQNLMKAGRVRGIAVCTPERVPAFSDVPTFAEKGYPEVNLNMIMTLFGPKGMPPEVIKAWEEALKAVMKKPKVVADIEKLNYEIDLQFGPEKIRQSYDQMREKLARIAKERGIKP